MPKPDPNKDDRADAQIHRAHLLEELARSYTPALSRYFERRVRVRADVPGLVQDVFLRLSKVSDLTEIRQPEGYLFRTAASALRDRARKDQTRLRDQHDPYDEFGHQGTHFSPDRVLGGRQAIARILDVLQGMPERTRNIFVLKAFDGERTMDIAQQMGLSRRAVEKHFARAMKKVVEAMEEAGGY